MKLKSAFRFQLPIFKSKNKLFLKYPFTQRFDVWVILKKVIRKSRWERTKMKIEHLMPILTGPNNRLLKTQLRAKSTLKEIRN